VSVETREGTIDLERLVALHGMVKSVSPVSVTAVYGESVTVDSGGSSINIGTLDCSAVASLTSHGGPITVNGLDGRATIDSSGGKIKVHLSAGVAEAHVRIYGGDIDLVVSPDARLHIHVSDADGMLLDGNFVHATVSSNLANLDKHLATLHGGRCKPFVTPCIMHELHSLGPEFRETVRVAKTLQLHYCGHGNQGVPPLSNHTSA